MNTVGIKPIKTTADLQNAKADLAKLIRLPNASNRDDNIQVLAALIEQFEGNTCPSIFLNPLRN